MNLHNDSPFGGHPDQARYEQKSKEENLRQWEKALMIKEEKPPRYRSKHNPKLAPAYSTFLKQRSSYVSKGKLLKAKPALPNFKEKPKYGVRTKKNYVVSNAVEAIVNPAKKAPEEEMRYTQKPDYGMKPEYLSKVQEQMQEEREVLKEYLETDLAENQVVAEDMPEKDRLDLIKQLKRKWGSLNKHYQKIIDTTSRNKQRRREKLEAKLLDIEKDIKILSRGNIKIIGEE